MSLIPSRNRRVASMRGFTLIELMVAVTVIGVLVAIAVPRFIVHSVEGRLHGAKPYLLEIAARQRAYFLERGKYCCDSATTSEDTLVGDLGVTLKTAGDYCYVVICRDSDLCSTPMTEAFIATSEAGDPTVEFEVWAILRNTTTPTIAGPNSVTCVNATGKHPPSGWVKPSTSSSMGHEGQTVVLRYPPPPDGLDAVAGAGSVKFNWTGGLSASHVLR